MSREATEILIPKGNNRTGRSYRLVTKLPDRYMSQVTLYWSDRYQKYHVKSSLSVDAITGIACALGNNLNSDTLINHLLCVGYKIL